MATSVFGHPLIQEEGETVVLSTTAQYLAFKPGYKEVSMYCASQWRRAICPKLKHALYYNGTTYVDYVQSVTDRDSTTHMPLDAMATTHYVYLGTTEPALGFYMGMGTNKNDNAATLDVEYCSTAVAQGATLAFTDVAGDSDGTDVAGDTLKQAGVYTFTLPSIKRSFLGTYAAKLFSECYWIRFKPSAALSATVDVNEIIPVYQNANYTYKEGGLAYQHSIDSQQSSGFVILASSGTPTLDVNWYKH